MKDSIFSSILYAFSLECIDYQNYELDKNEKPTFKP